MEYLSVSNQFRLRLRNHNWYELDATFEWRSRMMSVSTTTQGGNGIYHFFWEKYAESRNPEGMMLNCCVFFFSSWDITIQPSTFNSISASSLESDYCFALYFYCRVYMNRLGSLLQKFHKSHTYIHWCLSSYGMGDNK